MYLKPHHGPQKSTRSSSSRVLPSSIPNICEFESTLCLVGSSGEPEILAPFFKMEARKEVYFDNSASSNLVARYPASFYRDHQSPALLHVVGSIQEVIAPVENTYSRDIHDVLRPTASSTARSEQEFKMPPKRNPTDSPSAGTPAKVPKTEHNPEDFSNSVKKRLQSSTRTGQACDRCKVC